MSPRRSSAAIARVAPAAALAACAAAPPGPPRAVARRPALHAIDPAPLASSDPSDPAQAPAVPELRAHADAPPDVEAIEPRCQPGAVEVCNGIDDDCNGAIDDACGYRSGQIQVTAGWATRADVDLHVFDPAGEEVYYNHPESASGGRLDHDANAGCTETTPTVENVFWASPNPPRGTYRANVRAWSLCGAGATTVTVQVAVGGRVIGTWSHALSAQGASFEIPLTVE